MATRLTDNAKTLLHLYQLAAKGLPADVVEPEGPFTNEEEQYWYDMLRSVGGLGGSIITYSATPQTYFTTDADFTAKCGAGTTGASISRTSSAGISTISQADANAKALTVARTAALAAIVCPVVGINGQSIDIVTSMFTNNAIDETIAGYPRRSPLATLRRVTVTGASEVTFRQRTSISSATSPFGGTVDIDGVTVSVPNTVAVGVGERTIQLPSNGTHTLDWMDGVQFRPGDNGAIQHGGTLLAIFVTSGTLEIAAPGPRAKNAMLVSGDSISNTSVATLQTLGWLPMLRADLRSRTGEDWEVAACGYSSKGWKSYTESGAQAQLGGYINNFLIGRAGRSIMDFDLGVNDWNLQLESVSEMQATASAVVDFVHSAYPAQEVQLKTPVFNPYASDNKSGAGTLADYSSALLAIGNSRSWLKTLDASTWLISSDISASDHLHPINTGHTKIKIKYSDFITGIPSVIVGTPASVGWADPNVTTRNGLSRNPDPNVHIQFTNEVGNTIGYPYSIGIKYSAYNNYPPLLGATVRIIKDGVVQGAPVTIQPGVIYEDHPTDGLPHKIEVEFVDAGTNNGYLIVEDGTFTIYNP